MSYIGCPCDDNNEEYLGIAIPTVGAAVSIVGNLFGTRTTGATVYREDGARWSAKKQYWEDPPGTKAKIQSPKPSGPADICTGAFACLQSMKGGPVSVPPSPAAPSGGLVQMPKGATAPTPGVIPSSVPIVPPSGAYPSSVPFTGPVIAGLSTGPLVIAGLAAAGIYILTQSPRRRR
jgi:hypothetical protein